MSLYRKLPDNYNLNRSLINQWESVIPTLRKHPKITLHTISVTDAEKYKGDLAGFMMHRLKVPIDHLYPQIRLNGYLSSEDYQGGALDVKLAPFDLIDRYFKIFTADVK